MRNSTLDSDLSMGKLHLARPRDSGWATGRLGRPKALRIGPLAQRDIVHVGERYDWNRQTCPAAAIYVHRHGGADPDLRDGVCAAAPHPHLPQHHHPPHPPPLLLHPPPRPPYFPPPPHH